MVSLSKGLTLHDFFTPKPAKRPLHTSQRQRDENDSTQKDSKASASRKSPNDADSTVAVSFSSSKSSKKRTPRELLHATPITPPSPISIRLDAATPPTQSHGHNQTTQTPLTCTPATKKRKRVEKPMQQLYLDFGQANFGRRSICPLCNMLVVHGVKEDEENHARICNDYSLGVPFQMKCAANRVHNPRNGIKNDRDCTGQVPAYQLFNATKEQTKDFIVEVRDIDSLSLREKVLQVKRIIDHEMGFATSDGDTKRKKDSCNSVGGETEEDKEEQDMAILYGKRFFLYVHNKRVIGFCAIQNITHAFPLLNDGLPPESVTKHQSTSAPLNYYRSTKSTKAIMGVHQIWCHSNHRGKGVSSSLLDCARQTFVYGMTVPISKVAFSSPTWDGLAFAKRYGDTGTPLVYEYAEHV